MKKKNQENKPKPRIDFHEIGRTYKLMANKCSECGREKPKEEIIHKKCGKEISKCMCSDANLIGVPCGYCEGFGTVYIDLNESEEVPDVPQDLKEHTAKYFEKLASGETLHEANQILMFVQATLKADMDEKQSKIHWVSIGIAIDRFFGQDRGNSALG